MLLFEVIIWITNILCAKYVSILPFIQGEDKERRQRDL